MNLNEVNIFSPFHYLLPFGMGVVLHLNTRDLPLYNGGFDLCLLEIMSVVLEKIF